MDEKNKQILEGIEKVLGKIGDPSKIDELEDDGLTIESAQKEMDDFIFARQHLDFLSSAEAVIVLFLEIYKASKRESLNGVPQEHVATMAFLSDKISRGFVDDLIGALSIVNVCEEIKVKFDTSKTEQEKNSAIIQLTASIMGAVFAFRDFFERHDEKVEGSLADVDSFLGSFEFSRRWRNFKLQYQKLIIFHELSLPRMSDLSLFLVKKIGSQIISNPNSF